MGAHSSSPKPAGLLAMTAVLVLAALSGCMASTEAGSTLYVKDALTDDVAEVHVTFTKAQAKPAGQGWLTVYDGKESIELLSLSAPDAREKLADFDLAPGQYEGLRIAVSEVEVVHKNGTVQLLNVFGNIVQIADDFSVSKNGIGILVDFDLEAGVDLAAGSYTPVVKSFHTRDADKGDFSAAGGPPRQFYGASGADACAAQRDEELADAREDLDEAIADARADRDEELADGNTSEAHTEYDEAIREAQQEHDEEVADIEADFEDCLQEDGLGDDSSTCAAERAEAIAEVRAELDAEIRELESERAATISEAAQERDEALAENLSAEERNATMAEYDAAVADAQAVFEEGMREARSEHDEELAEIEEEHEACASGEAEDGSSDDGAEEPEAEQESEEEDEA